MHHKVQAGLPLNFSTIEPSHNLSDSEMRLALDTESILNTMNGNFGRPSEIVDPIPLEADKSKTIDTLYSL